MTGMVRARYTLEFKQEAVKRLKTLRGLTPHEYVCKIWTEDPGRFRLDPIHHTTGLYT